MAAVNDGNAVSLTLNLEKQKVVGVKIIICNNGKETEDI